MEPDIVWFMQCDFKVEFFPISSTVLSPVVGCYAGRVGVHQPRYNGLFMAKLSHFSVTCRMTGTRLPSRQQELLSVPLLPCSSVLRV